MGDVQGLKGELSMFWKKKEKCTVPESKWWAQEDYEQMVAEFPIGTEVSYLGIVMIVTYHGKPYRDPDHFFPSLLPYMSCDYVDDSGVINNKTFQAGAWQKLLTKTVRRP
jgi:hypothetical protein